MDFFLLFVGEQKRRANGREALKGGRSSIPHFAARNEAISRMGPRIIGKGRGWSSLKIAVKLSWQLLASTSLLLLVTLNSAEES
jgi:hypothetical protein